MMNPEEVRTLLVKATEDRPAGLTLMPAVATAPKPRRNRILAPALATLTVAAAMLVALVALPGATTSAQARVMSAVDNTGEDSYLIHADSGGKHFEGAVDPVRHLGVITNTSSGSETRIVGGMLYNRLDASSKWEVRPQNEAVPKEASAAVRLVKLSPLDPQAALAELRAATDVREGEAVSGEGWTGHRFTFSLPDVKSGQVSGTVDVDDQGRVRRLTMNFSDGGVNVMTITDYGTPVSVTAPPADQVMDKTDNKSDTPPRDKPADPDEGAAKDPAKDGQGPSKP